MADDNNGMLEVDDNFGLDDSAEDENEYMGEGDDQQEMNFGDGQDDQEDDDDEFAQDGLDDEEDDDDEQDDGQANGNAYQRQEFAFGDDKKGSGNKNQDLNTKKVENDQFDEALEVDDSNEIESDDDEQNNAGQQTNAAGMNQDDGDDDQELPGQYNSANYANLNVSSEVKELFEYINRYKPQKIDLDTTFRPFVPDYMPCVGEVDAFLKMPKPDGTKEDFGIAVLDETCNSTDASVLEMKYIQTKKTIKKVEMSVRNIENAEKNPKDIQNWINNVGELNKNRPPATVQYSKVMPDFDKLMEEWPPAIEQTLKEVQFPGPDIDLSSEDYAKVMAAMLDIPVHKSANNKGVVEAMHVMFTLYSDFKENQHFQKQQQQQVENERDGTQDFMPISH